MTNYVVHADSEEYLQTIPSETVQFIYIDPPFNTGREQRNDSAVAYKKSPQMAYSDKFDNYADFLVPFLWEAKRVLTNDGTLCVHLDWHEVHYVKVDLDKIFGRKNFLNHVIWSYDWGGRSKDRWPKKHDDILIYVKDVGSHVFNYDLIDRVPYMSTVSSEGSRFVTPEKAARGKTLTDVWWRSVIGTSSHERTGYPTQKPVDIVERLVRMHSSPGARVLDFFAGSGTTAVAAHSLGREFTVVDKSVQAIDVTVARLASLRVPHTLVRL